MATLTCINPSCHHNNVQARAARSTNAPQLVASIRLVGKTVILALEVIEIVGLGLALL